MRTYYYLQLFVQNIFPERLPGLEPSFLFFDNACGLRAHVKSCVDSSLLDRVALVVDVFHFSGHKRSHVECQEFCSPFVYPVLKSDDGSWLFNSSAAEQANSWFGRFQSRVKEMNVIRSVNNTDCSLGSNDRLQIQLLFRRSAQYQELSEGGRTQEEGMRTRLFE